MPAAERDAQETQKKNKSLQVQSIKTWPLRLQGISSTSGALDYLCCPWYVQWSASVLSGICFPLLCFLLLSFLATNNCSNEKLHSCFLQPQRMPHIPPVISSSSLLVI